MNILFMVVGVILMLPFIAMIIQLIYRELIGHGDCNSLADYPLTIMLLTLLGLLFTFGGTIL